MFGNQSRTLVIFTSFEIPTEEPCIVNILCCIDLGCILIFLEAFVCCAFLGVRGTFEVTWYKLNKWAGKRLKASVYVYPFQMKPWRIAFFAIIFLLNNNKYGTMQSIPPIWCIFCNINVISGKEARHSFLYLWKNKSSFCELYLLQYSFGQLGFNLQNASMLCLFICN